VSTQSTCIFACSGLQWSTECLEISRLGTAKDLKRVLLLSADRQCDCWVTMSRSACYELIVHHRYRNFTKLMRHHVRTLQVCSNRHHAKQKPPNQYRDISKICYSFRRYDTTYRYRNDTSIFWYIDPQGRMLLTDKQMDRQTVRQSEKDERRSVLKWSFVQLLIYKF